MKRLGAFTLIEVLAVVLLTGMVIGIALNFYIDLSHASNRASEQTRATRRAASLLDRMARDFSGVVYLKKPDALDPLAHPWIFLAESRGSELGADRVKFVMRNHDPQHTALPESDLAVVTYVLRRSESGGLELWRSETPGLPEALDREFPALGSAGDALLADDIAAFGMVFLDSDLQPQVSWDSSTVVKSNELPAGVEIRLAMQDPGKQLRVDQLNVLRRRVMFVVRPLDLEAMLLGKPASADATDLAKKTVCDCLDCGALMLNPSIAQLLSEIGKQPAKTWISRLPANLREQLRPECR
jgi:type II secretory pathway component PulJ